MLSRMSEAKGSAEYDLAVIGAGSAGFAAARTAADAGWRVALLDGAEELGGLCILRGCMPSKALLYAAEVLHLCHEAGTWGIRTDDLGFNFARVMARKDALIREFAECRRRQLADKKFDFIHAQARFLDPHSLALSNGRTLAARHFLIATGSIVAPAPLPELTDTGFITSDEALPLTRLPRSLIVLGGGLVAVELAQFFARFGVKVTLVQRSPHLLKEFDTDSVETLEAVLRREGIDLFTGTQLLGAKRRGGLKEVSFRHAGGTVGVAADEILFALGRSPNTARLNLEAAGVRTDGLRIVTDDKMQTSAPHIGAAGDCCSPHEIVHLAIQQAEIAAHNLIHPFAPRRMDYRLLVSVVFSDPQLARVGLTEKEAQARGLVCLVAQYPFNDHGKSLIMDAKDGFVKLLAHPATGEILGACCLGPSGGELIHEIVAAMHKRMTVQELAAMPHYHPTLAEIWTYPAEELAAQIKHLA
jgi:pyruvate/2-oxoglutarate dehydrogenase complex dihydrolipoamide dehydrogenase (E3) component